MPQQVYTLMFGKAHLRYLLHLPPEYGKHKKQRFPLILFLHGMGERGSDIEVLKQYGIPKVVEEQPDFPFITVSPQCPAGTYWTFELDKLNTLLDHVMAAHDVDTKRVYLTGLSMGGYATWGLAIAHPERFAAIAPICGGGDADAACALKDVPTWVFHGAMDNVVLIRESRKMVDALKECGGKVRFTTYPQAGHDSWTRTYANPKLYEWLLSHEKPAAGG